MKILYIAPLPPPLGGHSLAAKVLYDHLRTKHEVVAVDFNKESFVEGVSGFKRIFEVLGVLKEIWQKKKNADAIYLTISESFAGNLKDIFTYVICFRKLSKMYIHLHGGSIKRLLWDKYPFLHKLNRFFIKRMAGVIISGESHREVFADKISPDRIFSLPNFALDKLFVTDEKILEKFKDIHPIRVLYMSNMVEKKGYDELADAYIQLGDAFKEKLRIDFAGRFEHESQKQALLNKIAPHMGLKYLGMVSDEEKVQLFSDAHVFCLPTSYFEGQPVSILEGYASGCVVITTGQSGILDIFDKEVNGFQFSDGKKDAITRVLERVATEQDKLLPIALHNSAEARIKYRISTYNKNLSDVLERRTAQP